MQIREFVSILRDESESFCNTSYQKGMRMISREASQAFSEMEDSIIAFTYNLSEFFRINT